MVVDFAPVVVLRPSVVSSGVSLRLLMTSALVLGLGVLVFEISLQIYLLLIASESLLYQELILNLRQVLRQWW